MNLRTLARGKPCILCGEQDGTTVLHHIQIPGNHGTGIKPPDFPWGVRVCRSCHDYFHRNGRGDHKLMLMALGKQMLEYQREGVVRL